MLDSGLGPDSWQSGPLLNVEPSRQSQLDCVAGQHHMRMVLGIAKNSSYNFGQIADGDPDVVRTTGW